MTTQPDGGPAFPRADIKFHVDGYTKADCYGMTLLDYFAGQALMGYFVNTEMLKATKQISQDKSANMNQLLSETCYEIAQAMLTEKQRIKEGEI